MKQFLAEYWLWILIPSVVVVAGLLWLAVSGSGDDGMFIYNPF